MDPFKSAQAEVTDLQDKHDRLERAIPGLQVIEKQLNDNVQTLKRQEANIVLKLDKLQREISRRTGAFNEWQRSEVEQLTLDKQALEDKRKQTNEAFRSKSLELTAKQTVLADKETELKELEQKLGKARTEVEIGHRTNVAAGRQLVERETKVRQDAKQNTALSDKLATKARQLDDREVGVAEDEKSASQALKNAQLDREAADTLLTNAKDKIEATVVKEKELDAREISLNARRKELDSLAIRLNDRRQVIETNAKAT